jgi:hypothetical protein
MRRALNRVSYVFLCLVPFLIFPLAAIRALRVPGVYQIVGGIVCVAILIAAWSLGARCIKAASAPDAMRATAGALLLVPTTLMALLWVGLATPWDATPAENRMRYVVMLLSSIAVTGGFVMLGEALRQEGERFYASLGSAANVLAGTAYLVWTTITLGESVIGVQIGRKEPSAAPMSDVFDSLLFVASALSYVATAAFAAGMGRLGWLSQRAARAYVIASLMLMILLMMRGWSYPDPMAGSTAWWMHPAYIAGIPAVPWIVPFLLGVMLLRRAGERSP